MLMRKATREDSGLILRWRNDPKARKFSRNSAIITEKEHGAWLNAYFSENLNKTQILIFENENEPVGMIRFDEISPESHEISIIVDPKYRGQHLGIILIEMSIRFLLDNLTVDEVHAIVHKENSASLKTFISCGFLILDEKAEFVTLYKSFKAPINT